MTADIIKFPPSEAELRENAEEAYAELTERIDQLKDEGYRDGEIAIAITMLGKDVIEQTDSATYEALDSMADEILGEVKDLEAVTEEEPPLEVE